MFVVGCPSRLVWHPAVHHSLLFLRCLRQPYTLLLDAGVQVHAAGDAQQLLYEGEGRISIGWRAAEDKDKQDTTVSPSPSPSLSVVHQPDHIPYFFCQMGALPVPNLPDVQAQLRTELPSYLDACVITAHVHRATDALLLALQGGEPELVRRTNAALLDALAQLDDAMDVEDLKVGNGGGKHLPASTWPLFTTLQFLIEEGGLLTSALPRLHLAYHTLREDNKAVRLHHRLVERTLQELGSSDSSSVVVAAHPRRGFLQEAQRLLGAYTSSVQEEMERGVVGEKGAPAGRYGRMGTQAVPARLPWTMQSMPLKRQ